VEVKIGIPSVPRELRVETSATPEEVETLLRAALAADAGVLVLADVTGAKVLVPAEKIAYLEFGSPEQRRVGFGNSL
jgi:3-hydroxyacyl-CoA dehydrogenase